MQQSVTTRGVGGDGEGVARRIGKANVRVLLHAEIATGRWLAIESCREDTMLDGHPFRPAVHEGVETGSSPWSSDLRHLARRQLDGKHQPSRAESEHLSRSMLVEDIQCVVTNDILARPRELGE